MALRYCFETSNVRAAIASSKPHDLAVIDLDTSKKSDLAAIDIDISKTSNLAVIDLDISKCY